MKSTVTLCMIVKDEVKEVTKLVTDALPYFDKIEIAVSDEKAWEELGSTITDKKVTWWRRPWNNRFDDARNYIQEKVLTDYWFWLDSDDVFPFKAIPKLVEIADQGQYDQILLPYNYAQDDDGNCIAFHWRERLMRTSHPFTWKGWIHETPVTDLPFKAHRVNVPVVHRPAKDHVKESLERNHKILLEAVSKSDDPRYKLYLGTSLHARGEYGEALQVLNKFNSESGSSEDIYRSLSCMSECAFLMQEPAGAINYALQAAALIPEYPQAYWLLAQWESEQGNWSEALEWVRTADTKEDPKGMSVYDPTARERSYLIAAQCEFMQKNYNEALRWLRRVSPENEARQDLEEGFINEADAETFLTLLPKFRKYFTSEKGLYDALCYDLRYDIRLRGLRERVTDPKEWADNSIVILCGEGYEEWGPHTLDKGMGGSEEAVVYLSRQLTNLGWEVTIYGAVNEPINEGVNGPHYLPWRELDRRDKFNVFVAWRAPDFTEHINAKVKIADIHDVIEQDRMRDYPDVTYFVKSQYHRNLYPKLANDKFRVIGNGILKEQFND